MHFNHDSQNRFSVLTLSPRHENKLAPPPESKGHGWFCDTRLSLTIKDKTLKSEKPNMKICSKSWIRLLGTYNNIKHKWKSHQDKYWEVNWVFGVHVVHVILKRCPATLAKDLCYSAAWYKIQIQMWWPTTDMTVDEKDKKTKAKNPRIDSVTSGVVHSTGQKQKQKNKTRQKRNRKNHFTWGHSPSF